MPSFAVSTLSEFRFRPKIDPAHVFTQNLTYEQQVFAETIVPTLDAEEFESFRSIFEQIQSILGHLQTGDTEATTSEESDSSESLSDEDLRLKPSQAYKQILGRLEKFGSI
jgi:hypothetical protein